MLLFSCSGKVRQYQGLYHNNIVSHMLDKPPGKFRIDQGAQVVAHEIRELLVVSTRVFLEYVSSLWKDLSTSYK